MRVNYESTVDWRMKTDLLRINPSFHNQPRYDYAIIDAGGGTCFLAQLLYVFEVFAAKEERYMALILPFDETIPRVNPTNQVFRFTHVRSRHRSKSAFIDINSIVWGALLVNSNDSAAGDEYLLFDVLDEDFWYRMKSAKFVTTIHLH